MFTRGDFVSLSSTMSDTTPRKQASILSLWEHAELSHREIARRLNVNQSTASHLIKQATKTGSATPQRKGKCGRKRKTTPRDDAFVMRQSKLGPPKKQL